MGKGKKHATTEPQLDNSKEDKAAPKHDKKQAKAQAAGAAAAAPPVQPEAAAADTKPSKKRAKDEIDAIFSTAKKSGEAKPQEEQLAPELQQLAQEVGAARQAAQVGACLSKLPACAGQELY